MIPVTLLEFHLHAAGGLDLGANPGSSLRGALYEALRAMYDTGEAVHSRDDAEINPVVWLLRLEDEDGTGGKNVPRPIAVRPPPASEGERLSFGISFYGRGRDYIPLVISAVGAMQGLGVGRGRGRFTLLGIDTLDPLTFIPTPLIDGLGRQVGTLPEPPGPDAYTTHASDLGPSHLTVTFVTPTRIVQKGHLCHQPTFRPWFQRLLERTRQIGELYTGNPPWIPFRELLDAAGGVEIDQDATRWIEMKSGSRRDGTLKPTSGFVGQVSYRGKLAALLPWVVLGQALQVGKNTIKGCGWYKVIE
ncbi:MAG: CRISPR system precrRNA processing endoribonuclease RAMP protein Cas6 [Anaerolineae bacterium]|nr:CRISPR system precrRNA processing endoribonuclease RAMP protein Cas6 [Anaerolineae bacterium]